MLHVWSSSVSGSNSHSLFFNLEAASTYGDTHAFGLSARCIKGSYNNIALHKQVAPLTNTVRGDPQNITDGDPSNLWYSYESQNGGWILSFTIDLGEIYTIERYHFKVLQTRSYVIESSVDGVSWTTQHDISGLDFYANPIQVSSCFA